jgi:hypothetical protein
MLTEAFASGFYLVTKQTNTIPSIYVNRRGDENIGFQRGELLTLHTERLER